MIAPSPLTPEQYENLGRMTQSLLHAVNNSLASVTGFAEFLMEDLPQATQAHSFAANIHQSGQHLKKLVEQVRTINSAPRIAYIENFDLSETIELVLLQLTEALPNDINLQIDYECDLEQAQITGNRTLFCLAFLDIVNNALESLSEHPPASGEPGKILIELNNDESGKNYIVTIKDNGQGMDDLTFSECLKPFFTTKDSSKHHGLGLNVAAAIVTAMKGTLGMASAKDAGAIVTMKFPHTA
ncbi:MAG TPA: HAMP domain-containing sensor histidine kinase [Alphaproteobacteria bacterium]|nr:HAMP domain-containing sensor histidine kinase [Alphaproteobacteria bacterium]HNS44146.1 HAMP domain-containing sensor histidine kinase [Alphaproteobacteria bacterium]